MLTSKARIWLLTTFLALVAIGLGTAATDNKGSFVSGLWLPWWVLAGVYVTAELSVVHLYFRRDAHSFSMTEAALVIGLLFASPRDLLIAQALGCGLALLYRRQSVMKLLFNLTSFAVCTSAAVVIFRWLAPAGAGVTTRLWAAVFAAAVVVGALNGLLVVAAISLSEARLDLERLPMVLALSLAGAITNASLALVGATLLKVNAAAAGLLIVPGVTVYLAYRAYLREREKHESLEFLYQSTRILSETREFDDAIVRLLTQSREMFKAGNAAVVLTTPARDRMLCTTIDQDGHVEVMQRLSDEVTQRMWLHTTHSRRACLLLRSGDTDPLVDEFLTAWDLRDAMVGVLYGETSDYGLIVVGNRLGEIASFDSEDLRLFETLANHASVAFENGRLEQSLAQLRELEQRLKHLAYHDALTGLANRSLFADRVEGALHGGADQVAPARECAVIFIDLDDFKTVNDTLGHAAGDALLCAVAERLTACLRPGDMAARLGGDEFAVLLEGVDGARDATGVAQRITEALRLPVTVGTQEVPVRASIGIAPSAGFSTADELLRNADMAMYIAKSDGKGSFKLFESGMATEVTRRHRLKAELARGATSGEFLPWFQPIVDLGTGRTVALEALARWNHPVEGTLLPDSFIAMAEETGLIADLEREILRSACEQVADWQVAVPMTPPLTLTVNLSPRQLRRAELVSEVADAIASTKLAPGSLVLEITESSMLDDAEGTIETLRRLRALGIRLAVDDFGTGYSSLEHLRRLPVNLLKIPKTFVDDLGKGAGASAFAQAIVTLGSTLGLTTIAEGVEHPWQASELRRLGCALAQGYHFSEPLCGEDVEQFLAREAGTVGALARVIPLLA